MKRKAVHKNQELKRLNKSIAWAEKRLGVIDGYHAVLTRKPIKPSKADSQNPARMEEIRLYNLQLQSEKVAARKALKILGTPIVNLRQAGNGGASPDIWRPDGQRPVRGSQKRGKPSDRIPGGFKRRNMLAG